MIMKCRVNWLSLITAGAIHLKTWKCKQGLVKSKSIHQGLLIPWAGTPGTGLNRNSENGFTSPNALISVENNDFAWNENWGKLYSCLLVVTSVPVTLHHRAKNVKISHQEYKYIMILVTVTLSSLREFHIEFQCLYLPLFCI